MRSWKKNQSHSKDKLCDDDFDDEEEPGDFGVDAVADFDSRMEQWTMPDDEKSYWVLNTKFSGTMKTPASWQLPLKISLIRR